MQATINTVSEVTSNINAEGLELIAAFAKANKVSRAKIEAIVSQVLAVQPAAKSNIVPFTARPKRDVYHAEIIKAANENGGIISRAELARRGMKMVAFATDTLEAEGKIKRIEPTRGSRGRPSVTYQLIA